MKTFHDKQKLKQYMTTKLVSRIFPKDPIEKMKKNITMKGWELLNIKRRANK
jgi:hypothetical protein